MKDSSDSLVEALSGACLESPDTPPSPLPLKLQHVNVKPNQPCSNDDSGPLKLTCYIVPFWWRIMF